MLLLFNSFLFIDLYLTLKNPFFPRQQRAKWFYLYSCLGFVIYLLYFLQSQFNSDTDIDRDTDPISNDKMYPIVIMIFSIFTLTTVLLVVKRLTLKGTSRTLKQKVFFRHILYSMVYLTLLLEIFNNFYWEQIIINESIEELFEVWLTICGFLMGTIRIFEPYVFQTLRHSI